MKTITSFQVCDLGIDGAQYFPGDTAMFSEYDFTQVGQGDNFAEAIEDAIESLAMSDTCDGADFKALRLSIAADGFGTVNEFGHVKWQESASATAEAIMSNGQLVDADEMEEMLAECDVYYYVSLRYTVEDVPAVASA